MYKKRRDYGDKKNNKKTTTKKTQNNNNKQQQTTTTQNLPDPYTCIPHIPVPHEQLPSYSILTSHCHYHFKSFRHTQFNTNTYIDKSLRNMYYSGVSTPFPRLTIVQQ